MTFLGIALVCLLGIWHSQRQYKKGVQDGYKTALDESVGQIMHLSFENAMLKNKLDKIDPDWNKGDVTPVFTILSGGKK